jgi:hypothetical protein
VVEETRPDPLTDLELHVVVVGVLVLLRQLLRLEKALTHLGKDLITAAEKGVHNLRARRPRPVWQDRRRRVTVHHLEGAWRGGRCGRRCCNNIPPTTANPPTLEVDHL